MWVIARPSISIGFTVVTLIGGPGLARGSAESVAPPGQHGAAGPRSVFALDGIWTPVPMPTLSYSDGYRAAYDPARRRLYLYEGTDGSCWRLDLEAGLDWVPILASGTPPPRRRFESLMYDPVRDRLIVYGGETGVFVRYADVWALTLGTNPTWSQLAPTGIVPPARQEHTVTYDPVRDRMIVFGGFDGTYTNSIHALSLAGGSSWSSPPYSGGPVGRRRATMVYDAMRDRMIVFGGGTIDSFFNDVWSLPLTSGATSWAPISPAGTPPKQRELAAAFYDPTSDRLMLLGGWNPYQPVTYFDDIWQLSLGGAPAWMSQTPAGLRPRGRLQPFAFYESQTGEGLFYGGSSQWGQELDTWTLSLQPAPEWRPLVGPPPGQTVGAIYDPLRRRMLTFGPTGDTWALSLEEPHAGRWS